MQPWQGGGSGPGPGNGADGPELDRPGVPGEIKLLPLAAQPGPLRLSLGAAPGWLGPGRPIGARGSEST